MSDLSVFEASVPDMAREICANGRLDAVAQAVRAPPAVGADARRAELVALPMKELRGYTKAAGATVAHIEAVTESADPREALVSLTLELELDSADEQSGGLQLAGLSMKEL